MSPQPSAASAGPGRGRERGTAARPFSASPRRRASGPLSLRPAAGLTLALALVAGGASAATTPLDRYFYQSWSAGSGLPQISVNDMLYDGDGMLWVATENGLARFDGSRFEVFNNATTPALASSWLTRLHRDGGGRLWIATVNNVARFDGRRFTVVPGADSSLGHVTAFAEDAEGRVLVAGERLLREDGRGGLEPDPTWRGAARALLRHGEALWIAGDDGRLVRREGGRERELRLPALAAGVVHRLAWAQGRLWIGSSAGLHTLAGGRLEPVHLRAGGTPPEVLALAADEEDVLWVGTYQGLYRAARGRVLDRPDPADAAFVPWVISLLPDGEGGMWLGSRQSGLRHLWRTRAERLGVDEGLADPSVWSFWVDGRDLLVGTDAGVDRLRAGRFESVVPAPTLADPTAYSLAKDRRGRLWVGLRSGLVRFDHAGGGPIPIEGLRGLQINGMLEAEPGGMWVASSGGLFRVTEAGAAAVGPGSGLTERRVRFLLHARDGGLWVGTENGLFVGRGDRFARAGSTTLDTAFVTALLQLRDGRLVAGTNDRGLYLQEGDGWRRLMPEEGLPSANVFFLGEEDGALIVGFRDGVYRVRVRDLAAATAEHPLTVEMLLLDEGDRVGRARIRCCNGGGNGKGVIHGGAVWLPSLGGVVRVPLAGGAEPPPRARVAALVQDQRRLPVSAALRLPTPSRNLQIHYGAVDFRYPGRLRYRYRLVGFDDGWVEADDRALAIYTNLPPGPFRFEVAARHAYQAWGPVAAFDLVVPKRPVETWPVRLLLAAAAVLLVVAAVRWRIARLRRRQRALEALVEARTRELQGANARLEEVNRALAEASLTDPLTGLHNRRFLREEIAPAMARLQRLRGATGRDVVVGALLLDLDHFKAINDTYGHAIGDTVLQGAAAALRAAVRGGDLLLRWGGEEFLVVVTDAERAELGGIAERLRAAMTRTDPAAPQRRLTASLGYAAFPLQGVPQNRQSWQSVLDLADHALYGAKAAGRDRTATIEIRGVAGDEWPEHVRAAKVEEWYAEGKARLVLSREPGTVAPAAP